MPRPHAQVFASRMFCTVEQDSSPSWSERLCSVDRAPPESFSESTAILHRFDGRMSSSIQTPRSFSSFTYSMTPPFILSTHLMLIFPKCMTLHFFALKIIFHFSAHSQILSKFACICRPSSLLRIVIASLVSANFRISAIMIASSILSIKISNKMPPRTDPWIMLLSTSTHSNNSHWQPLCLLKIQSLSHSKSFP